MADLNISVDMSDVQKLQTALGDLGPAFGRAVARIKREEQLLKSSIKASADTVVKALNEVVGAKAQRDLEQWGAAQRKRLSLMEQSEKMAQRETAAILKQRDATERLATANARAYQSQIGGNLGLGAVGISASASAGAFESEMERLRSKYDQVYASSKRYEAALEEINLAHSLGVFNAKQHEMAVERLNQEFAMSGSGAAFASGRMSEWGVVTQQAGYQVGDFFVQIQSGTNWMVAFGQQATQLVGVLPLVASSLGLTTAAAIGLSTALGIGIPVLTAIGAYFMRTGEAADSASKEVDSFIEAITNLDRVIAQLNLERSMFLSGAGSQEEQKALDEIQSLLRERVLLEQQVNSYRQAGRKAQEEEAAAQLRIVNYNISTLESKLRTLNANELLVKSQEQSKKRAEELAKAIDEGRLRAQKLQQIFADLSNTSINVAVNFQAAFSGFTGQAAEWAAGVGNTMQSIAEGGSPIFSSPRPRGAPALLGEPDIAGGSGGGGGGAGNARLESLISELQTESETLAIWYEESQTALQSASDAELAIIGGKHDAMLRLTEEYVKRKGEIETSANQWSLESALGGAAEVAGALGAFNKKALKAQAVLAAGSALVSTYQGAAAELKKGTFGFASAAAVIAKGIGFVAAIKSAGEGNTSASAGGGGRGVSSVPPSTQEAQSPQTVYIDSLDPTGLYSGQTLINLFDALYNENDKRGKVFVVARG